MLTLWRGSGLLKFFGEIVEPALDGIMPFHTGRTAARSHHMALLVSCSLDVFGVVILVEYALGFELGKAKFLAVN